MKFFRKESLLLLCMLCTVILKAQQAKQNNAMSADPAALFLNPPAAAKPGVLWMWMGANLSTGGITKDLESLKAAGFNRTTMFSLADITTPWAGYIGKDPTPEIISWTEPWWKLVRHAAVESKRLGMDFGMFNGPSYTSSGGKWITPELSMQEISWSDFATTGNQHIKITLRQPTVNLRANQFFPHHNPENGKLEKPEIAARKTYYKDIAVVAVPASGIIPQDSIIDLTAKMQPNGELEWDVPAGNWTVYRFGHTTRGTLIQPAQWEATGFECDKMSPVAVNFHLDHVIGEIQKHLGDLIGTGFTHVHFDSYEAGYPTWTPMMRQEFLARRGYDLIKYLPTFAKRTVGSSIDSLKFAHDFDATINDLYRDVYFTIISRKLKAAHLTFLCEPYGGPWRQDEIMPLIPNVMTEFWTHGGKYMPVELEPTVAALRKSGQNIVEAEAFTGDPKESKWSETPAWLKSIGDAAFCAGVNRMILHRFVQQPWGDQYKPGNTMGQWGTHFDRTQTWWKPGKAMVAYWARCQALLQWGKIVMASKDDFKSTTTNGLLDIKQIHRNADGTDIYFVANTARFAGKADCSFKVTGKQPELWDPVTKTMRNLPQFTDANGSISIPMKFDSAQSFFIVFRKQISNVITGENFTEAKEILTLGGPWQVQFDPLWGGPIKPVSFASLQDWTTSADAGIKYFSGTAVYTKTFDVTAAQLTGTKPLYINLGQVNHIARVKINKVDMGVVWTAPWTVKIPAGVLKTKANKLEIEVTNVWANRLIGDEQETADIEWVPWPLGLGALYLKEFPDWFLNKQPRPSKGRFCFTTWNYFDKNSPLISSGLLGPVKLERE
ncbi:MAG: hypothetical protein H7211_02150 [Aquabacterium sp.]|nr:hypothetical protein [Ferruginibacter sp.]